MNTRPYNEHRDPAHVRGRSDSPPQGGALPHLKDRRGAPPTGSQLLLRWPAVTCASFTMRTFPQRSHSMRRNHDGKARRDAAQRLLDGGEGIVPVRPPDPRPRLLRGHQALLGEGLVRQPSRRSAIVRLIPQ